MDLILAYRLPVKYTTVTQRGLCYVYLETYTNLVIVPSFWYWYLKIKMRALDRRVSPKIRQFCDLGSASTFFVVEIIKEYILIS